MRDKCAGQAGNARHVDGGQSKMATNGGRGGEWSFSGGEKKIKFLI